MAKFTCNFISYTLKRTVDITVVLPTPTIPDSMGMTGDGHPHHTPKEKYPVVYLLHGMGNNHAQWTGYTNVELFAEERQIAIVNISAENKSYVKVGGDDFFTFVSQELPDFVTGMFPVSTKPEDTYIAGLSMGGFGTLVHALSFPERFKAFGAFSAAVHLNPGALMGDDPVAAANSEAPAEYNPSELAKKIAAEGKAFPKAYIACGAKDFLYEANQQFRDELIALGADVTWDEHPDYGHEWRFWNLEIEKFLDWLPRTDVYAQQGKRQI
ncbi:MAG: hypothetical protein J1E06_05605 [Acutalibacter sp.]|nr:hypothetical protein [Acutalibacter sp.]